MSDFAIQKHIEEALEDIFIYAECKKYIPFEQAGSRLSIITLVSDINIPEKNTCCAMLVSVI
jgi:hypothetical protein